MENLTALERFFLLRYKRGKTVMPTQIRDLLVEKGLIEE